MATRHTSRRIHVRRDLVSMVLGWVGIGWMIRNPDDFSWPIFVFCALATGVAGVTNLLSLAASLERGPESTSPRGRSHSEVSDG